MPRGIRGDTTARAATTPFLLKASTQSLSLTPISAASSSLSQIVWPPRNNVNICWLSKYILCVDHLLCGVKYFNVISGIPSCL